MCSPTRRLNAAAQLYAIFATGFTTRFAVESALMLEPGKLDRYLAGEDQLTEAEEIRILALLGDYERRIRQANADAAYDRMAQFVAGTERGR